MKKKNDNILDKNLYDIAFNERDKEIKKIELMRKHVEADIEEAINQYVKAGGNRKFKKKKKNKVSPLIDDGIDIRGLK